jgi:hypothetical protein
MFLACLPINVKYHHTTLNHVSRGLLKLWSRSTIASLHRSQLERSKLHQLILPNGIRGSLGYEFAPTTQATPMQTGAFMILLTFAFNL